MKEEFTDARTDEWTNGRTDERTHDGHNAMTIARWPLASGAKNLKKLVPGFSLNFLLRGHNDPLHMN